MNPCVCIIIRGIVADMAPSVYKLYVITSYPFISIPCYIRLLNCPGTFFISIKGAYNCHPLSTFSKFSRYILLHIVQSCSEVYNCDVTGHAERTLNN